MKGIIVLDMPECCTKCCFSHVSETNYKRFCGIVHKTIYGNSSKPDWCPIKPMPQKRNFKGTEAINGLCISAKVRQAIDEACKLGWNSCIDAIIGEK